MTKLSDLGPPIIGTRQGGPPADEAEYFVECPVCGQSVDCRDLRQVMHHASREHDPLEWTPEGKIAPPLGSGQLVWSNWVQQMSTSGGGAIAELGIELRFGENKLPVQGTSVQILQETPAKIRRLHQFGFS